MKKKMLLLIFTLFIGIILCGNVSAAKKMTCKYRKLINTQETSYTITFSIYDDVSNVDEIIKKDSNVVAAREYETDVTEIYKDKVFNLTELSNCPNSIGISSNNIVASGDYELIDSKSETIGSCLGYKREDSCKKSETSGGVSCVWNEIEIDGKTYGYCNVDKLTYVACGDTKDIPSQVPALISFAVNLLKIAAPLILIFVAIISLLKAMASSNEDEMKKAQKSLIRKIIPAVLVFFVVSIVQFVISLVADNEIASDYNNQTEVTNMSNCLNCFLNNDCAANTYYRTNFSGEYYYYNVVTNKEITFDREYYVSTEFYEGKKNIECESLGYFDSYHPKAVSINGSCYTLTDTGKQVTNYTQTLSGQGRIYNQTIYSANNSCYYWEGRINDYIKIDCDTEMVTAFYRGKKTTSCDGNYFNYNNTDKEGYQPKSITISGTCYGLTSTSYKYVNETLNLFGESKTITQKIWQANNKCYYWEGTQNRYIETECRDHY